MSTTSSPRSRRRLTASSNGCSTSSTAASATASGGPTPTALTCAGAGHEAAPVGRARDGGRLARDLDVGALPPHPHRQLRLGRGGAVHALVSRRDGPADPRPHGLDLPGP